MDRIRWCMSQKNGLELITPNDNLRNAYIIKGEEALEVAKMTTNRDWQITAAYYAMYHGLYSLLMKIGVKCEIHTCTIGFARRFLNFTKSELDLLECAFSARNDAQYYVDRKVADEDYELIMKGVPSFLVKCKNMVLDQKEVTYIRGKLSALG